MFLLWKPKCASEIRTWPIIVIIIIYLTSMHRPRFLRLHGLFEPVLSIDLHAISAEWCYGSVYDLLYHVSVACCRKNT